MANSTSRPVYTRPGRSGLYVPRHLASASTVVGVYWLALMANLHILVFAVGACLAFYVPGALLVVNAPALFSGAAWIERTAMSVIGSVAYISVSALILDYTPAGITQVSLAASVTAIVLVAWLVEAGRGTDRRRATSRSFTLTLVGAIVVASAWPTSMTMLGGISASIYGSFHSLPERYYSEVSGACVKPRKYGPSALTLSVGNSTNSVQSYRLTIRVDGRMVSRRPLWFRLAPRTSKVYHRPLGAAWNAATASVRVLGRPSIPLLVTLRPSACAVGLPAHTA